MKKLVVLLLLALIVTPTYTQDDPVEGIPACSAEEIALIPILLVDSGFFLDYAMIAFSAPNESGMTETLQPMLEMLAVRDVWVEAIVPNLPNCVQSIEFELAFGDYIDQALIQMMTLTIGERVDEIYRDRSDIENARLQVMDLELNAIFEVIFADFDVEAALMEQMEALEGGD